MEGQWGPIKITSQSSQFLENTVRSVCGRSREGQVDRVHWVAWELCQLACLSYAVYAVDPMKDRSTDYTGMLEIQWIRLSLLRSVFGRPRGTPVDRLHFGDSNRLTNIVLRWGEPDVSPVDEVGGRSTGYTQAPEF